MSLQAYEVELMWQLSEQGEYPLDYGLLFELEKAHDEDLGVHRQSPGGKGMGSF